VLLRVGVASADDDRQEAARVAGGGPVVLVGGVLRYDNATVWRRIVALAGGEGARIAVIPAATGRPRIYGGFAVRALAQHGADATLLPVAPPDEAFDLPPGDAVRDPSILELIGAADGVFFTGGAPQRVAQLLHEAGKPTPLAAALKELHARGGLIAGANAGAVAISTGIAAPSALRTGLPTGAAVPGLALLDDRWLFDQHVFTHHRLAVSLVAMHELGVPNALGVGVNAAVVIRDGEAEVIGNGGALVLRLTAPGGVARAAGGSFEAGDVAVSYLADGDRLSFRNLAVTPAPRKREGFPVDPRAPDHEPWVSGPAFHQDPFVNPALTRGLLFYAFDGSRGESVGLVLPAPDGAPADDGFRFRFHRGPDTRGWQSGAGGSPDFTVVGLRLDVTGVTDDEVRRLQATAGRAGAG
jgi:cyanophycinase